MAVAGVDVGGTNITVGAVTRDHELKARDKQDTPAKAQDAADLIIKMVKEVGDVRAVGVGIPGLVDGNTVLTTPNLQGWDESFDLVAQLEKALKVPVFLGNDADVGLLGEWQAGAAKGCDDVLGIWLGTGVGGSLILAGRPYRGGGGLAAEFGHMIVQPDGAMCGCGRRGCIEAYLGRRMMGAAAQAEQDAGRPTKLFEIMKDKGKSAPTSSVWFDAIEAGDEVTTALFDTGVAKLGVALGSALNLLDVDMVVFGGGMTGKFGEDLVERAEQASLRWTLHPRKERKFVVSELGDDAGVVGAAALARASLIAD